MQSHSWRLKAVGYPLAEFSAPAKIATAVPCFWFRTPVGIHSRGLRRKGPYAPFSWLGCVFLLQANGQRGDLEHNHCKCAPMVHGAGGYKNHECAERRARDRSTMTATSKFASRHRKTPESGLRFHIASVSSSQSHARFASVVFQAVD